MHFQISPRNLLKQKKRKTDLAPGTLEFSGITPQPTNSWFRIWNPELFHILTRGPSPSITLTNGDGAGRPWALATMEEECRSPGTADHDVGH